MCEGMNPKPELEGHVVSIHLHATTGRAPLRAVESVEAVTDKGLRGDARYFGRRSRSTGGPSRRQVTLIGREVLERHADVLGIPAIPPGVARSNIETLGVGWEGLVGKRVAVGDAVLEVVEHRTPCEQMEAIAPGLRALMEAPHQGVIARVVQDGWIRLGDAVKVL